MTPALAIWIWQSPPWQKWQCLHRGSSVRAINLIHQRFQPAHFTPSSFSSSNALSHFFKPFFYVDVSFPIRNNQHCFFLIATKTTKKLYFEPKVLVHPSLTQTHWHFFSSKLHWSFWPIRSQIPYKWSHDWVQQGSGLSAKETRKHKGFVQGDQSSLWWTADVCVTDYFLAASLQDGNIVL